MTVTGLGTAALDFGATPANEASVTVTGQTEITAECSAEAWFMARTTADNNADAHKQAAAFMRLVCSEPTPGAGFVITAYCLIGSATGEFTVDFTWSD